MAELAAGQYRFAKRRADGTLVSYSDVVHYDVLNNATAPRVVFPDPRRIPRGTDDDEVHTFLDNIDGRLGEVLEIQLFHTASVTFTTTSCTVALNVLQATREGRGWRYSDRPLVLGDRVTKSTASTRQDARGQNDNPVTIANEWSTVMRFIPTSHEVWRVAGPQRFVSDAA